MNTSALFDTALAGLQSAQSGMLVTSQNVAGASVDGYVRRSPSIRNVSMAQSPADPTGSLFAVEGFTRHFDALLQRQIWGQTAKTAYTETLTQSVIALDAELINPATSIAGALGAFFNAAGALANEPSNAAYQAALVGNAEQLADRIRGLSGTLDALAQNANQGFVDALHQANALAPTLADINAKIRGSGILGVSYPAADLLDERDRLVNELQKLVGGQAIVNADGTASFEINGQFLVDREIANRFTTGSGSSALNASIGASGVYLRVPNLPGQAPKLIAMFQADQHGTIQSLFDSGRAGGFAQLATEFVPQLQRSLTLFSAKLMQDVNGISMRNGTDAQAIFGFLSTSDTSGYLTNPDQDELTTLFAGDLSIRDVLERLDTNSSQFDATRFAAFQAIKNEVEPGLLKVVPSLGSGRFEGLQTTEAIASLEALRTPFARATADFTSSTAQTISTWNQAHGSNQVTESALADQKQSISGVNLDEEAANLVKYQQLYNASSKVMQTSRQMFDTLLAMLSGA